MSLYQKQQHIAMTTMYHDPAGEGDEYYGAYDEEHIMLTINTASEIIEDIEDMEDPIIETDKSKMSFDEFLDYYIKNHLPAENFIQSWMDYNFASS